MARPAVAGWRHYLCNWGEERGGEEEQGVKGLARLGAAGPPVPGQPRPSQAVQVAGGGRSGSSVEASSGVAPFFIVVAFEVVWRGGLQ
jgi:hypothetical protein